MDIRVSTNLCAAPPRGSLDLGLCRQGEELCMGAAEETMDRKMSIRCGGGCGGSGRSRDGGARWKWQKDLYEDGPVGNATRLLLPSLFYDKRE